MKQFLENIYNEDNPLEAPYGGIPDGGGFGSGTEFEVGIQRICEAVHCVLGSLTKTLNIDWVKEKGDVGHIKEECGLIEKDLEEYSKDLYKDRFIRYYHDEKSSEHKYAVKSYNNIIKQTPKLKTLVLKHLNSLKQYKEDTPKHVYELGVACYEFLSAFCDAIERSLKWFVEDAEIIISPFRKKKVEEALKKLLEKRDNYFKEYK